MTSVRQLPGDVPKGECTMKPVNDDVLVRQLHWRYATKKFDPDRKISAADWLTLEQALVYAPSSFGLQPWKFFVVTDQALREKLKAASWNQAQITDASHLVVFAVKQNVGLADVERHLDRVSEVRGLDMASLESYKQMMLGALKRPADEVNNWANRQVYISLGFFLSAAAMLGIDACPMEGFDPAKYDEILGLPRLGYGGGPGHGRLPRGRRHVRQAGQGPVQDRGRGGSRSRLSHRGPRATWVGSASSSRAPATAAKRGERAAGLNGFSRCFQRDAGGS